MLREFGRPFLGDERGVVFLEMLIAFAPMWVFSLCVFQLVLIARADLVVRHAADAASRSAAVVLPDDPGKYDDEAQMSVGRDSVVANDLVGVIGGISTAIPRGASGAGVERLSSGATGSGGRSRLNTIRLAAHAPLMPLAPVNIGADPLPSLRKALGDERALLSSLSYQPLAVAVTFPHATDDFVQGPEVTVRVSYALQCTVPIARHILCASFEELKSDGDWVQSFAAFAQRVVGGRFRQVVHESTTLIHQAPYEYRPRTS